MWRILLVANVFRIPMLRGVIAWWRWNTEVRFVVAYECFGNGIMLRRCNVGWLGRAGCAYMLSTKGFARILHRKPTVVLFRL
ncbi:Uncharacterised protein [Nocardia brasiliensis]|nr:Uncharacterised protein [Nocardia brasiliensis]